MGEALGVLISVIAALGFVLLLSWLSRRNSRIDVDEIVKRAEDKLARGINPDAESSTSHHIILNDQGFRLVKEGESCPVGEVRWRDVREIRTYKLDLFSYDEIYLAFRVADDSWVEISEGDAFFLATAERMREEFQGIPETWYQDVMRPPFATNDRQLYLRPDNAC